MINFHGEKILLTAASATGTGQRWPGGVGRWVVYGTWDGATAQLQMSPDDGTTWIDVDNASETSNGGTGDLYFGVGDYLRVTIASAGASTSLNSVFGAIG